MEELRGPKKLGSKKMSKEGEKKEKREKITIVLPRVIFPFTLKSKEDHHKYHTKLK